ncbi:aldo/keto reductase [candidate division KSB3 bacterium]|uniref:Aldo/keto reductase n=1 Tax=candidate division KSB3 bacterium TaxID=2044937 RepID=A0A9D5Q4J1_9BACT|nr:aldo/keto reductase [candidate division KSB3 bacterium]MBD3323610.1 aldo/keto reductase [candidate division KSB3 bacterium]
MVSPIGLGCWQFSKRRGFAGKFWPVVPDEEITEIVRVSLEGGVNWFDTAEVYGWGESEKALAQTLEQLGNLPEKTIIATKWWPMFRTARSITKTINDRLTNLHVSRIDLHQVHQPYAFASTKAQMQAMAHLVSIGKVQYVGVSNFSAAKMRAAHEELTLHKLRLTSNQVKYSLLQRDIESNGILATAKELGIAIIAYSPLAQGLLTGKFHENPHLIQQRQGFRKYQKAFKPEGLEQSRPVIKVLNTLAEKYQVTPAQIALNWLVTFHGDLVVAIPGATKVTHAQQNTGAMTFRLTQEELERLDQVSAPFKP